jgi:hypothetical protein
MAHENQKSEGAKVAYGIVTLAVLSRFLPHPFNFSPVIASLLFAGVHMKRAPSLWFPLAVLAVSDLLLSPVVYRIGIDRTQGIFWFGFACIVAMGWLLRNRVRPLTVGAAALVSSVSYFLISNFGVWIGWNTYPKTWEGLVACYVAALPYFQNSLVGDLFYAAVIFGTYQAVLRWRQPARIA